MSGEALALSPHAVDRCLGRGISLRRIFDAIAIGNCIERHDDKVVFECNRLRVVVKGAVIITAYRMPTRKPKRDIRKRKARKTKLLHSLAKKLGRKIVRK